MVKEIEVLIVTGATIGKVEANSTGSKHRNAGINKSGILMTSAVRMAA